MSLVESRTVLTQLGRSWFISLISPKTGIWALIGTALNASG
jgi:hypothetical protein